MKKILLIYILLSNFFSFESKSEQYCNVLALEGGGDKGAYQGGAIKGLIDNLPSNESVYDVVTGISVGSINAAALSTFEEGDEKEAADFIVNTWREIQSRRTIYQNWWLGPLYGLFNKSGIYNTSPLEEFLTKYIHGRSVKRKIVIGSTDIDNGSYVTWDETDFLTNPNLFVEAVMASSAFPILFPMKDVDQNSYIDGGVKVNVDISSGINRCKEMGFKEENIIVDTILCTGADELKHVEKDKLHPLEILMRVFEIFGYDRSMREVSDVAVHFPKVQMRYVISPSKNLPFSVVPLVFSPKNIDLMINIGMEDGKKSS